MPHLFILALRREGKTRIKMKIRQVKMGHLVFAKLNNFVGKELKIEGILCWRGKP